MWSSVGLMRTIGPESSSPSVVEAKPVGCIAVMLTILFMLFLNLDGKLTPFEDIEIRFVPAGNGCEFRARKMSDWRDQQSKEY